MKWNNQLDITKDFELISYIQIKMKRSNGVKTFDITTYRALKTIMSITWWTALIKCFVIIERTVPNTINKTMFWDAFCRIKTLIHCWLITLLCFIETCWICTKSHYDTFHKQCSTIIRSCVFYSKFMEMATGPIVRIYCSRKKVFTKSLIIAYVLWQKNFARFDFHIFVSK
jgi:hypothetical protein